MTLAGNDANVEALKTAARLMLANAQREAESLASSYAEALRAAKHGSCHEAMGCLLTVARGRGAIEGAHEAAVALLKAVTELGSAK